MVLILAWSLILVLLALWSLAAWALHAVAVWTLSNAGAWSGTGAGLGGLNLPPALEAWLPAWALSGLQDLLATLGPVLDSVLQAAPALASGLSLVSWGLWALGSLMLVLLGAGLHGLIAAWRRRQPTDVAWKDARALGS